MLDDDHVPAEEGFASRRRMLLRVEVVRAFQGGDECCWGVSRLSLPFMAARSSGNDRRGWYWGIPVVWPWGLRSLFSKTVRLWAEGRLVFYRDFDSPKSELSTDTLSTDNLHSIITRRGTGIGLNTRWQKPVKATPISNTDDNKPQPY
jgi:hypothetical protein